MSMPGSFHEEEMDETSDDLDWTPPAEESEVDGFELEIDESDDADAFEDEDAPAAGAADDEEISFEVDPQTMHVHVVQGNRRSVVTQGTLAQSPGLAALLRRFLTSPPPEDRESEEEEDPYDNLWGVMYSRRTRGAPPIFKVRSEPDPKGAALLNGGEFVRLPHRFNGKHRRMSSLDTNVSDILRRRESDAKPAHKQDLSDACIPNSVGVEVCRFSANMYCGQYSDDGSFYYTCGKDFKIRIYDTTVPPLSSRVSKSTLDSAMRPRRAHTTGRFARFYETEEDHTVLSTIKTVSAHDAYSRWTITDANLSPSNDALIYSSIGPVVNFVRTKDTGNIESMPNDARDHVQLNFSLGSRRDFGIWSVRFSADAREIVAGANQGLIFVYDIDSQRPILRLDAHNDDVNAVCFADTASSNVLVSGSDDGLLKVWDRRSLQGQTPSGVLVGHTEGLTFVAAKGDGRYVVSNGKDQTAKLWDLRMMYSAEAAGKLEPRRVGVSGWDYRRALYVKPKYHKHPNDVSVCTYTGHSVLQTLIRCHFSPAASTGQRYIYSGSADGRIHIWNLDGTVNTVLDRRDSLPINTNPFEAPKSTAVAEPTPNWQSADGVTVRDVSWHPHRPEMMSVSWEDRHGSDGAVVLHQWQSG